MPSGTAYIYGHFRFPDGVVVSAAENAVAGSAHETVPDKPYVADLIEERITLSGTSSITETARLFPRC